MASPCTLHRENNWPLINYIYIYCICTYKLDKKARRRKSVETTPALSTPSSTRLWESSPPSSSAWLPTIHFLSSPTGSSAHLLDQTPSWIPFTPLHTRVLYSIKSFTRYREHYEGPGNHNIFTGSKQLDHLHLLHTCSPSPLHSHHHHLDYI